MSSVLIIEPHCEGHHVDYASWIIEEAASCGHDIVFATSRSCLDHPQYVKVLREHGERIRTFELPSYGRKPDPSNTAQAIWRDFQYYKMFADCYRRVTQDCPLDYVFLPYDYCLYATSVLGSPFGRTPWGGMVLRPAFHLQEMGVRAPNSRLQRLKAALFLRLLRKDRSLVALYTLDETLTRYVQWRHPTSAERLRFLPEPVELDGKHSRESARRALGIPQDAAVILVYGVLDFTKGIDALLDATATRWFPSEARLLLAGPQRDDVRKLLDRPQAKRLGREGRLHVQDMFLYGSEEQAIFLATDMVWVGYKEQYVSSGVLLQAAVANRPILACDVGVIAWMTKRYRLGLVVDVTDDQAVARAVSALIHDQELAAEYGEGGRRLSARHSVQNFRERMRGEVLSGPPFGSTA